MHQEGDSVTWAAGTLAGGGDGATDGIAAALLYEELRRLVHPALNREAMENAARTTDIVHQAFERLFLRPRAMGKTIHWPNRLAFYAAAAKTIQDILVDEARRRLAQKRGGGRQPLSLEQVGDPFSTPPELLVDLRIELQELSGLNARAARVVELRFFGGLALEEIAQLLDVSERTVRRDWDLARLWLYRRLHDGQGDQPGSPAGDAPPEEDAQCGNTEQPDE